MLLFPSRFSDNLHKFDEVIHVTESVSTFIVLERVTRQSYFELFEFLCIYGSCLWYFECQ